LDEQELSSFGILSALTKQERLHKIHRTLGGLEARTDPRSSNGVSGKAGPHHYPLPALIMASMRLSSLLTLLFLSGPTLALQVSSKSPCTSLCLDASQNTTSSSSTSSPTLGSDISCLDSDYAATSSGRRFMSCVSCLQTSTASDENGSDQQWFLCKLPYKGTRTQLTLLNR
jgi:hypothetical protein